MKVYLPKTPKFVPWLYPKRIWAFSRKEPNIYLTFDDGPHPEITPWVLEQLKVYNAKATFFLIGDNLRKYPEILTQIIAGGHSIGNHTYNHLQGTLTSLEKYLQNVQAFENECSHRTALFRPPYGKMKSEQAWKLQEKGYKIVMWDVLSYDWDKDVSAERCAQYVIDHIQPGSVVVFHDSVKAERNMKFALPKVLKYLQEKQWNAKAIEVGLNEFLNETN